MSETKISSSSKHKLFFCDHSCQELSRDGKQHVIVQEVNQIYKIIYCDGQPLIEQLALVAHDHNNSA